jgi:valyl-tRNA synthetase
MNEISSHYNPREVEDRIYRYWQDNNLFSAKANPHKKPFCIVIPPPNVTGILHMGHALNNTYQDILIRLKRMQGFESLWVPGTDHAGIATQNLVERQVAREGLKRQDLGRERFLERVWLWKEQYGSTIIRQLKKLGVSCDWQRERFTMDEQYSEAVKEVFVRLWEKGLIYQDNKIINWCPRCQTALSDEEAPHRELQGNLYYIRYLLKESQVTPTLRSEQAGHPDASVGAGKSQVKDYVAVATTRPETMLGDTAVAVHPEDRRYKKFINKTLILPLVNREIKIIADEMVDMKFGTGAVKVTPAHDPNDYVLGKRHSLPFVNVMYPDGRMNENALDYKDMDRFEAREVILEDLKEKGFLEKVQAHSLSAGHCYRCHTIIEPYLSRQWFVKMRPLARPAIEAVKDGRIRFHPKRWMKVCLSWMENIQDWCISRQIWWGHRLPVYYCRNCRQANEFTVYSLEFTEKERDRKGIIVSKDKPETCPGCGAMDICQDEDVLDTWFSSWLWPFATFYWPFETRDAQRNTQYENDLKYFYPTSLLATAPEIIFFWVARMIMAGFEFMGREPFKNVFIHPTVRDVEGKKMSKSLGNIIDPLEIVDRYGSDALRFSLMSLTSAGQDIYLSEQKFESGRNFANKLWNASRFSLMSLDLSLVNVDLCVFFEKEKLGLPEKWILSRFYSMLGALNKALDSYRFNDAAGILYEFIWHEFCDWYLELIKPVLVALPDGETGKGQSTPAFSRAGREARNTQVVLYKVLEKTLRCLHPFMPFITEEIWQKLQIASGKSQIASIMIQPWPHLQKQMIDRDSEQKMRRAIDVITAIRNLKSQMKIPQRQKVDVIAVSKDKKVRSSLEETSQYMVNLAKISNFNVQSTSLAHKKGVSAIIGRIQIFMELEGIVDIAAETARLNKEIGALGLDIKSKEARLKNKEFLQRAPQEIIKKEKESLSFSKEKLLILEKIVNRKFNN